MGNQKTCLFRSADTHQTGTALLETSELIFRPQDGSQRLKIPFSTITSAKTHDGELQLQTSSGPLSFTLGPDAEKWCHKILHPKTRIEKLGIKPESKVTLQGPFDSSFLKELRAAAKEITETKIDSASDVVFLSVNSSKELASAIARLAKRITGATALWIVYPKGKKEITENEVLAIGRKSGLTDIKVVGFSPTHTALKFVLPLKKR
jgi:hypothetical protein